MKAGVEGNGRFRGKAGSVTGTALRLVAVALAVTLVTAVDFRVFHVNGATAAFTYLLLILALATRLGLRESITASIVSVAAYNFFFLPPVGTFTIADVQNWVALLAYLATAITASQLSASAKRRAEEAHARQEELQRMYDFSRGLILGREDFSFSQQIVKQVVESFQVRDAALYDSATGGVTSFEADFDERRMAEVAVSGKMWRHLTQKATIVPVRLGGAHFGSLAIAGETIPSEVALQAIAQLVAIAIERARVQEISARMEVTRQNEQLKSTVLDALAHEFKTPLTSVKAATTTLLSSALSDGDRRELVTIVDEEADRLTRLVSDSIELARIGTAPVVLNKEVCSSEDLIASALNSMRGLLEGREFRVEICPGMPPILVDRNLSELALRQLLNNALRYSPQGSAVGLRAEREENFVLISVSNRGAGIAKAEQAKIFEKFYRGPEVRGRIPGTGMGLTITREIVESQGGSVRLETEPGKGATFSITLPTFESFEENKEGRLQPA